MYTYLTIKELSEGLYKEKGSRFIAFAYPVSSVDEVKNILFSLRKEYHDARHICYAYIIGIEQQETRANDDGEPSGTAGKPIQGVLLSNNLTNVLVAVVRYFGGVKLGTSGLITAYREAASDTISNAEIIEKTVTEEYSVLFEYPLMNEVMRVIKEEQCDILEQKLEMSCQIRFKVQKAFENQLVFRMRNLRGIELKH